MTEFISRKYGNDGYEVIIKTDCHEHYKASENFARRLIDHAKHMTHADRIRSMSDGELAEFLSYGCPCPTENCRPSRVNCIGNWLQQPAEVE